MADPVKLMPDTSEINFYDADPDLAYLRFCNTARRPVRDAAYIKED